MSGCVIIFLMISEIKDFNSFGTDIERTSRELKDMGAMLVCESAINPDGDTHLTEMSAGALTQLHAIQNLELRESGGWNEDGIEAVGLNSARDIMNPLNEMTDMLYFLTSEQSILADTKTTPLTNENNEANERSQRLLPALQDFYKEASIPLLKLLSKIANEFQILKDRVATQLTSS